MSQGVQQPSEHEPWAIRLAGDEAVRGAGDNLRVWAGDERGGLRRLFDRVTFREERDPKLLGAWGEERVAKELAKLGTGWTVVHGVRIGPKADVDHVVVGPAGVFSLNTKWIKFEAAVRVSARRFLVNGYSRDYYPKAVREAQRVSERLKAATGSEVSVQPVLAVTGADPKRVEVLAQPPDVAVVLRRELCVWLQRRPAVLSSEEVRRLAVAIRRPSTWDPSNVDVVLDRQPPTSPPIAAEVDTVQETAIRATAPQVEVVEWRRYGHHRRYVNDAGTGKKLGWRDERTGKVNVEEGVEPSLVHAALGSSAEDPAQREVTDPGQPSA